MPHQRLVGVDLARLVALLGMFTAHLVDREVGVGPGGIDWRFQLVAGRSAALFAVLAGVSLALSSPLAVARSDPGGLRRRILVRAALVGVLGLWLGLFGSGIAVILTYYAVLFCCALPVLTWRASRLALLALGWGLLSPVASLLLRRVLPEATGEVPSLVMLLSRPLDMVLQILVTGYYPVLTWATYLFVGLAVGRLLRESGGSLPGSRVLVLGGAGLAAAALGASALLTRSSGVQTALLSTMPLGPSTPTGLDRLQRTGFYGTHPAESGWWLGVWVPHSGSVVDLAHTVGTSLLVLGVCLWLVRVTASLPWSVLAGAGTMSLTFYTAHVLLLASPLGDVGPLARHTATGLALQAALTVVIGAVVASRDRRGPLESVVSKAVQRVPLQR